jgi:hypothetical protein
MGDRRRCRSESNVTNKVSPIIAKMVAIVLTVVLSLMTSAKTTYGLSLVPEIFTYKTCADSPPGFSPGCMDNVTVYPGGRATFNCQVNNVANWRLLNIFLKGAQYTSGIF